MENVEELLGSHTLKWTKVDQGSSKPTYQNSLTICDMILKEPKREKSVSLIILQIFSPEVILIRDQILINVE